MYSEPVQCSALARPVTESGWETGRISATDGSPVTARTLQIQAPTAFAAPRPLLRSHGRRTLSLTSGERPVTGVSAPCRLPSPGLGVLSGHGSRTAGAPTTRSGVP